MEEKYSEKRKHLSDVLKIVLPPDRDIYHLVKGHATGWCRAAGRGNDPLFVEKITVDCMSKLRGGFFVDLVYKDFNNFFTSEELKELSEIARSPSLNKAYSEEKDNPLQNIFLRIYELCKYSSRELIEKERRKDINAC